MPDIDEFDAALGQIDRAKRWCLDDQKQLFLSDDPEVWVASMAKDYVVGQDVVGMVWVSTVFLSGIDFVRLSNAPPELFETMVFDRNGKVVEVNRYATWQEADRGHHAMVAKWLMLSG